MFTYCQDLLQSNAKVNSNNDLSKQSYLMLKKDLFTVLISYVNCNASIPNSIFILKTNTPYSWNNVKLRFTDIFYILQQIRFYNYKNVNALN